MEQGAVRGRERGRGGEPGCELSGAGSCGSGGSASGCTPRVSAMRGRGLISAGIWAAVLRAGGAVLEKRERSGRNGWPKMDEGEPKAEGIPGMPKDPGSGILMPTVGVQYEKPAASAGGKPRIMGRMRKPKRPTSRQQNPPNYPIHPTPANQPPTPAARQPANLPATPAAAGPKFNCRPSNCWQ